MTMEIRLIISGILLGLFCVSKLLLDWTKKRHKEDPEYQIEQARREKEAAERRRKNEEEAEKLREYTKSFNDLDYSDDDYNDTLEMTEPNNDTL